MLKKTQQIRRIMVVSIAIAVITGFGFVGVITATDISDTGNQFTSVNQEEPTVYCTDETVAEGSSTTVQVFLTEAPNGLNGFSVQLTIPGTDTIEFDTDTANSPLGNVGAVTETQFAFASLNAGVSAGSTNILLGEIDANGTSSGTETISVTTSSFVDGNGNTFQPATHDCSVTVN